MKNNVLKEIGDLSEPLGSMQMLKIINFKNNPLVKVPKYRDYVVILSKGIGKQISNIRTAGRQENTAFWTVILSETVLFEAYSEFERR